MSGLEYLSYEDRLRQLDALSLTNMRLYTDIVTVFKYLHGRVNYIPADAGLGIAAVYIRAGGVHLHQCRVVKRANAKLFPHRAASTWNKLHVNLLNISTLKVFQSALFKHLLPCEQI